MQVLRMTGVGTDYIYRWPDDSETFAYFVDYLARDGGGKHEIRIAIGIRKAYGQPRTRVIVFIDNHPEVEFFGTDDFDVSGEVMAELKIPGNKGERMCRYPGEAVPERYSMFNVQGLPLRASGPYLHNAWGVVASICDHRAMIALAALRRLERNR